MSMIASHGPAAVEGRSMVNQHSIIQVWLIQAWFNQDKIAQDAPAQVDGGGVGGTEG
jgi:hypothetical protein